MFRRLVLTALVGLAFCILFGVADQPLLAVPSEGHADSSPQQHPQMDAAPAVSGTTASGLQPVSLFSQGSKDVPSPGHEHAVRTLPPAAQAVQHSIQASTFLRI